MYVTVVGDASRKTQQGPATTNKQPWQLEKYSCLEWNSLLSTILFAEYIFLQFSLHLLDCIFCYLTIIIYSYVDHF